MYNYERRPMPMILHAGRPKCFAETAAAIVNSLGDVLFLKRAAMMGGRDSVRAMISTRKEEALAKPEARSARAEGHDKLLVLLALIRNMANGKLRTLCSPRE